MAANTRATRSRFSSPAQPQVQVNGTVEEAKERIVESSRSFMHKWLEPSVQKKASFEEAGLMRYGVVENMGPLGSLPKIKKTPAEGSSGVRRIILRPSAANSSPAPSARDASPVPKAAAASSPPPPPQIEATAAATSSQRRKLPSARKDDDGKDEEYEPKPTGSKRRQSGRVPKPKKLQPEEVPKAASPDLQQAASVVSETSLDPSIKAFVDKVVQVAVDEALDCYRYPTAYALRTLYDEKCTEPGFVAMMEDVFSQTANADTVADFISLLEARKREGAKSNRAQDFFDPPSPGPKPKSKKHQATAAPYAKMLKRSEGSRTSDKTDSAATPRAAKKIKITHTRTPSKTSGKGTGTGSGVTKARTPGSRKKPRRSSASSESSLSSVASISTPRTGGKQRTAALQSPVSPSARGPPSSAAKGAQASTGGTAATFTPTPAVAPTTTTNTSTDTAVADPAHDAPRPRPITTRGKTLAASKHKSKANTSDSNSPSATSVNIQPHSQRSSRRSQPARAVTPAADESSMPGRVSAAELFPDLSREASDSSLKDGAALFEAGPDDGFWDRRKEAKKITNDFISRESSIRGSTAEREATPTRSTRRTRQSFAPNTGARATRSASKRPLEDADDVASPTLPFPPLTDDASSVVGSRAVTPSSQRPAKKQKTGIRIKLSPIKKKGAAAGIPRPVGESHIGSNGATREQSADNDEYCSACGNAGDVLCCDGCPRSFHFECVGMVQADELPDEWYCNECLIKRYPSRVPVHKGIFGSALNNLEKSIPRAFSLPKKLQYRFEGVKVGKDGDYDEVVPKAQQARRKTGYEESPDFFKQREDGQAVLCHDCQKSATDDRAIIPCSVCTLYWHIDCLDPPLAVPPYLKTWRCPAHAGDILAEAPLLAPAHRFRRLKGAQLISPAISRGLKNNGHIELDWTDEPEPMRTGWPDPQSFGRTYKLPVKGVVLDFIEQLRHKGAGYGPKSEEPKWISNASLPAPNCEASLRGSALDRDLEEMQVSLTLTSLKQSRSPGIDQLTSALLNAADPSMLALMAKTNAHNVELGKMTHEDKVGLRAVLAQMDAMSSRIRIALGEDNGYPAVSALASPGATSIAEPSPLSSPRTKVEHGMEPMTEPTPPSTVGQAEGPMDLE